MTIVVVTKLKESRGKASFFFFSNLHIYIDTVTCRRSALVTGLH